jgi:hypothetical protein
MPEYSEPATHPLEGDHVFLAKFGTKPVTKPVIKPDTEYLASLLAWAEDENEKRKRGERSEWDQGNWITLPASFNGLLDDHPGVPLVSLPCGTACCIAGKVALDAGGLPALVGAGTSAPHYAGSIVDMPDGTKVGVDTFAAERLGITVDQAEVLFSGSNDIEDLRLIIGAIIADSHIGYQQLIDLREWDRDTRPDSPAGDSEQADLPF